MTTQAIVLLVVYLAILLACTKPLGLYIAWVMDEQRRGNALKTGLYRLCGVRADAEMNWKQYALAVLIFNTLGALFVYALQRLQAFLLQFLPPLVPVSFIEPRLQRVVFLLQVM